MIVGYEIIFVAHDGTFELVERDRQDPGESENIVDRRFGNATSLPRFDGAWFDATQLRRARARVAQLLTAIL